MDVLHRALRLEQLLGTEDLLDGLERVDDALRVEDRHLLTILGVAELQPDEEAVQLRFRQREGALVLDRVLRRHDEERLGELVGRAVDGDLMLLHRFEECGLRLRRRAVDLIGEDDLAHDRPGPELESAGALVEDRDAGDVRWQQVRRELDTPERTPKRPRDGLREDGFPGPGHVLDEDVAAADQGDERQLDLVVLAKDDLLDVRRHRADAVREGALIH